MTIFTRHALPSTKARPSSSLFTIHSPQFNTPKSLLHAIETLPMSSRAVRQSGFRIFRGHGQQSEAHEKRNSHDFLKALVTRHSVMLTQTRIQ
jgi:hypothetical protein